MSEFDDLEVDEEEEFTPSGEKWKPSYELGVGVMWALQGLMFFALFTLCVSISIKVARWDLLPSQMLVFWFGIVVPPIKSVIIGACYYSWLKQESQIFFLSGISFAVVLGIEYILSIIVICFIIFAWETMYATIFITLFLIADLIFSTLFAIWSGFLIKKAKERYTIT